MFWHVAKKILFKGISNVSSFSSGGNFYSAELNGLSNFRREHHEEHFCVIILNMDSLVQERMGLKDISYLEFWRPFCSAQQNRLCNFGRRHYEEHFCQIILNLDSDSGGAAV